MSPPPRSDNTAPTDPLAEYSTEERSLLLTVAHRSIEATLAGAELDVRAPSPHLEERRGAFTTLHLRGELRGCVGYVLPVYSLYRTIAEAAAAAAFNDVRFPSVTREEAPLLNIEISVLSPVRPIAAEEIEVGRHGLVITYGMRRGLLLPQVPVEHGWDRLAFLAQTCLKAGAPPDAWQHGAVIEAFTAEVFGE
ncbi:MAG: AmmeMemoRadiSam system protein A [Acidobacteriia bacterium]|nr:AmmeMemoRadiSam system protein A [Terriglobia bacterium]